VLQGYDKNQIHFQIRLFLIFYNAVIGVRSQIGSRENPPNVNCSPSPIPTNVQKTEFPSGGSPTVVTPQIFPIVNQRCDF
jgi:hypothetical protein